MTPFWKSFKVLNLFKIIYSSLQENSEVQWSPDYSTLKEFKIVFD